MAGIRIEGDLSGTSVEVSTQKQMKVMPETDALANANFIGGVRTFSENDSGIVSGTASLLSSETDSDYRLRVGLDTMLDEETFNYTAQNTGKHNLATSTMTGTFTAGQFTTNGGSITTAATGVQFSTYAYFPSIGTHTLAADFEAGFSAQPVTNTFVEFGIGLPGAATTAPTDGVFFRLNSAGLQGIVSFNGTETSTGVFPVSSTNASPWLYTNSKRYQFIAYNNGTQAEFWIDDGVTTIRYGVIQLPSSQGRMTMASGSQAFFKHRIVGGVAGGVLQSTLGAYSVRVGGANFSQLMSTAGNRLYGSYQGTSGGTMGSLANYANNTNPTAAVPTNTTAALGAGLGGQFWETVTLAVNTDGIICSYQVPVGTANLSGRRLVIRGIGLTSHVQTVIVGGPYVSQYSLAFGHTAISLATGEAATTKAPRRVPLAGLTQVLTAAQAVSTMVSQPGGSYVDFGDAPIFVNPGEFVALVTKHIGTVGTSGTVAHVVTFVYGWE